MIFLLPESETRKHQEETEYQTEDEKDSYGPFHELIALPF